MYLDNFSDTLHVLPDVPETVLVLDDAADPQVETTEDNPSLDILNKCLDVDIGVEHSHVLDISIYKSITYAFSGIRKDLMIKLRSALIDFPVLNQVVHDVFVENPKFPHFFVDQGQELDVLGSVLDHGRGKGPLFPEFLVFGHQIIDFFLLGVDLAHVLLKKVVERNVDISVVILLEKVRNEPVRNLGVKYEVADQIVLPDKD